MHTMRNAVTSTLRMGDLGLMRFRVKALINALKIGRLLRRRGVLIDIYRTSIIRLPPCDMPLFFTVKHRVTGYYERYVVRMLNKLGVE